MLNILSGGTDYGLQYKRIISNCIHRRIDRLVSICVHSTWDNQMSKSRTQFNRRP